MQRVGRLKAAFATLISGAGGGKDRSATCHHYDWRLTSAVRSLSGHWHYFTPEIGPQAIAPMDCN